jgi:predicted nucleic acid-binding Zn ribbon protein
MKRKNAEQIGILVRRFLRQQGMESPLNEQKLMTAWSEVLGPAIDAYTDNMFIRNQTLYVHLRSSVLRQELMMGRQELVRNLNKKVGAMVITDIVFR